MKTKSNLKIKHEPANVENEGLNPTKFPERLLRLIKLREVHANYLSFIRLDEMVVF